jgi:hypothetical protein
MSRVEKAQESMKSRSAAHEEEYTMGLAVDLLHTGMDSKGASLLCRPGLRTNYLRSIYYPTNPKAR